MAELKSKSERQEAIEELAMFILRAAQEYKNADYAGMINSPARWEALANIRKTAIRKVEKFANSLNKA